MDNHERSIRLRLSDSISFDSLRNTEQLFNEAVASFLLEDYDASRILLSALSSKQHNPRWLLNYGYLLYQNGDYDDALRAFRELIDLSPFHVEAYLNSIKTCLALKDYKGARTFCNAIQKIAPNRSDVKKAIALYHLETGDFKKFLAAIGRVPNKDVFIKPSDHDIRRLQQNSSTVIGDHKISVMIVVFSNIGLRTVLVGYKDENNIFPKPAIRYRWHPLTDDGKDNINIELIEPDDTDRVALIGYNANGLEYHKTTRPHGFLIADFYFRDLSQLNNDNYVGLLLVDYDKVLRLEPRQIYLQELIAVSEGDLVDLYQDMIFPKSEYSLDEMKSPKVFLSYAKEDSEISEYIFKELKCRGVDVWKDDKSLRIGEVFEDKIEVAIEKADFAIVCLSSKSVRKVGFVQKEFRKIIETSKYRPADIPFALPVKLDDCVIPREFRSDHWKELGNDKEQFISELAEEIIDHYNTVLLKTP